MPENSSPTAYEQFIDRWAQTEAAERANYVLFLTELCALFDLPQPAGQRPDDRDNAYVFERAVTFHNLDGTTSAGRIDLYRRGCFVLEAKQGSAAGKRGQGLGVGPIRRGAGVRGTAGWTAAMQGAKGQAEQYARALPADEPAPPFLVVVDVGFSFELYADFSRAGRQYLPFPDARNHRFLLRDLLRPEVRETLRQVWLEPFALDPTRRSAQVTRSVAGQLAALAKSFEENGYAPERVAAFLMRCLFTMFAEDVKLLPEGGFTRILQALQETGAQHFPQMIGSLWADMDEGRFSQFFMQPLLRFNGGLFASHEALPVNREQLELLLSAARADWREVEPAIFGTLLERALDPLERHKLGAHYTPRAYVERLVLPTIIEPLREEWEAVKAAAVTLDGKGQSKAALDEVRGYLARLCQVRVLDPACGSGNFLYVTLEQLKRLEGEVRDVLAGLAGGEQEALEYTGLTVDPHQFLGLEINPRAASIADLVLWIGYLQWHFRTRGDTLPAEPVLHDYRNIERRDAVLDYDAVTPLLDENGEPVTRWDGRTMKLHPVTGAEVPDETARVPVWRYANPRPAVWPAADYVIGNPPFIGPARLRQELGEGYTAALRGVSPNVPESADLVMYWWDKAAGLLRAGKIKRFGFITTNSLRQTFNRRVLEHHLTAKTPLSLLYAIPDHPWVDTADGANVRIAMTVAQAGEHEGLVLTPQAGSAGILAGNERESAKPPVTDGPAEAEFKGSARPAGKDARAPAGTGDDVPEVSFETQRGKLFADLRIGANVAGAVTLQANERLSNRGVVLHGAGFIVTPEEAARLGLGRVAGLEKHLRQYRNGRDLTGAARGVMVIDLYGLTAEEVRARFPEVFQWVYERVKPERDHNRDAAIKENWWLYGRPRPELRDALNGLRRHIATVETAKHRFFVFLDESILPDNMLVNIALDDAFFLGVLSSRVHVVWALATGGTLEDRPRYNKTRCFDTFPFPECNEAQRARTRELGAALDAHRQSQQAQHPRLTLTEMYNALARLRAGETLTAKDQEAHEQGLVSILQQLHDELDAAVAVAYGWPATLSDEDILARLVELNAARAAAEQRGDIHWLRPEYQRPAAGPTQIAFDTGEPTETVAAALASQPWPASLAEQARAVRLALAAETAPVTATTLARRFTRARAERIAELLATLTELGAARETAPGRFICSTTN